MHAYRPLPTVWSRPWYVCCSSTIFAPKFKSITDNIAPPVASCLGDLITLCFIGVISTVLIRVIDTPIPFILAALVVIGASVCFVFTIRNRHVRPLLTQGWTPLFGAMAISSATGIVLDRFVSRYEGFALLAVVISGMFHPQRSFGYSPK